MRDDPDYLVLLAILWSCPEHLLGSSYTPVQKLFYTDATDRLLWKYEEVYPEKCDRLIGELQKLNTFSADISEQSINLVHWYHSYRALLEKQKRIIKEYEEWRQKAAKGWSKIPEECKKLQKKYQEGSQSEEEMSLRLAEIFLEYVRNKRKDSRYRARYEDVEQRVGRYVEAWRRSLYEGKAAEDPEDEEILDDMIGTNFDRLRFNATKHELLCAIGPAYICWIFANRILKIGNPRTKKVNLFMNEKELGDLFSINDKWHEGPASIADRAEVYMFDALCELWGQENLASPELSRMLFARSLPIHQEFMKANHPLTGTAEKPTVRTEFCTYENAVFSDEFLQRIFSTVPKMLRMSVEAARLKRLITQESFERMVYVEDERELLRGECFGDLRSILKRASINVNNVFGVAKTVIQEGVWKDFETLFLLDERGIGSEHTPEWEDEANTFFEQVIERMDFEWEFIEPERAELLEGIERGGADEGLKDIITLLCLRKAYGESVKKIVSFSKREFYKEHLAEQYQRLKDLLRVGYGQS